MDRALDLLEPDHRPTEPSLQDGYLDLLGDQAIQNASQRTMANRFVVAIYERFSRPLLARLLMGRKAPGTRGEHRIALEMLALSDGDRVLDLACGPGNFTGDFAAAAGAGGLVVGFDASAPMLAFAVRRDESATTAYVRGDAGALPFRAESFDAICCFGALHLFDDPFRALDEIVRVLAPSGRLALLAVRANLDPGRRLRAIQRFTHLLTGARTFARDELPQALRDRGLVDVEQRVVGAGQFVSARLPAR
jgi:ubiquinone/menaquinone biosynthesis C-methylase UbiE